MCNNTASLNYKMIYYLYIMYCVSEDHYMYFDIIYFLFITHTTCVVSERLNCLAVT